MENIINSLTNFTETLDKTDIIFYLFLSLIALNFITIKVMSMKTRKLISKIPAVSQNENINETLSELNSKINDLNHYKQASGVQIQKIAEALKSLKKIETKKYNPFSDAGVGGLQSFSTAMIDEKGDGIILSSLYSRTSTRVTLKEINSWDPAQELSPEEKEVLEKTKG